MIVALIILSVVLFWDLWLMAMAMIKQADLEPNWHLKRKGGLFRSGMIWRRLSVCMGRSNHDRRGNKRRV